MPAVMILAFSSGSRLIKHPCVTFAHLLFRGLALLGTFTFTILTSVSWHALTLLPRSVPTMWLVLGQLHRELCLDHPSPLSRLLDCQECQRPHTCRAQVYLCFSWKMYFELKFQVVELHQWWRGIHLGVWEQAEGWTAQTLYHWGSQRSSCSMLLNLAGVNILGGSHCCTCLLGSLLLHCSLLSKA